MTLLEHLDQTKENRIFFTDIDMEVIFEEIGVECKSRVDLSVQVIDDLLDSWFFVNSVPHSLKGPLINYLKS